jgi:hypothetical protein
MSTQWLNSKRKDAACKTEVEANKTEVELKIVNRNDCLLLE